MTNQGWFSVDKEGLAKLCERRGKVFILHELLQNAWDCGDATKVFVTLEPVEGRPLALLTVTDDSPEGFRDLSHSYTLFAESSKKSNPSKRGRFNLGEKLALALCEDAQISSTTGTVAFGPTGRGEFPRRKRQSGTEFSATVRMTRDELDQALDDVMLVLPPAHCRTFVNGIQISPRTPFNEVEGVSLQTEEADESGYLKRRHRDTTMDLYEVQPGERATLYEMGIPVMELGDDPWHVDVGQKIPLSMERDAAPPAYVSELRAAVLEAMHESLTKDAVVGKWASDALEGCNDEEAVRSLVTKRFGERVVVADPSDREGENIAKSQGYTVIPGGAFTKEAWVKIREAGAALPAGQVTPSPKPFSPDGEPLRLIHFDEYTGEMRKFEIFTQAFSLHVADLVVRVSFTEDKGWPFRAAYTKQSSNHGKITFNLAKLDPLFMSSHENKVELLLHELGHHWGHHLDAVYHEKLTWMGARAVWMAIESKSFAQIFRAPEDVK